MSTTKHHHAKLTMDDVRYAQENGLAIPDSAFRTSLPEGYSLRLRSNSLKTPVYEFKGPATRGKWRSTGEPDIETARMVVWEASQRGITLGEALSSFPPPPSKEHSDQALLAHFGADYPISAIKPAAIRDFIEARRRGIYRQDDRVLKPPKDDTIKRNIRRLHRVAEKLKMQGLYDGDITFLVAQNYDLRCDDDIGKDVFIDEYHELRAALRDEGLRLVLDYLTVFAADEIAARVARRSDVHLENTPKCRFGFIEIHGSKTDDRDKPKPLNAQSHALARRLVVRLTGSEDPDPLLFPEIRLPNGEYRRFGQVMRRAWPRYKDLGKKLTCMSLRRTCCTALRQYLDGYDCDLYLGHKVEGVRKHYDQLSILDLAPKIEVVRFPFLPDPDRNEPESGSDEGSYRFRESQPAGEPGMDAQESCPRDLSATGRKTIQPIVITGECRNSARPPEQIPDAPGAGRRGVFAIRRRRTARTKDGRCPAGVLR